MATFCVQMQIQFLYRKFAAFTGSNSRWKSMFAYYQCDFKFLDALRGVSNLSAPRTRTAISFHYQNRNIILKIGMMGFNEQWKRISLNPDKKPRKRQLFSWIKHDSLHPASSPNFMWLFSSLKYRGAGVPFLSSFLTLCSSLF